MKTVSAMVMCVGVAASYLSSVAGAPVTLLQRQWPGNVATFSAPVSAAVTAPTAAVARPAAVRSATTAKRDANHDTAVAVSGDIAAISYNDLYGLCQTDFYSLASWPPTVNLTISNANEDHCVLTTPIALAGSALFVSDSSDSVVDLFECDFATFNGCTRRFQLPSCSGRACSMAVSEDGTLLVLADVYARFGTNVVQVYACEFATWTCTLQVTLAALSNVGDVAVQGDVVVVGEVGGVEVFVCNRQSAPWSCRAITTMLGSDGYSVDIAGSLVAQATYATEFTVYLYQCDYYAETCLLVATLPAPDGNAGNFAYAVAVTGTSVTVADYANPGHAWNYNCTTSIDLGGPWTCTLLGAYQGDGYFDAEQVGAASSLQSGVSVVVQASLSGAAFAQLPPTELCTVVAAYATPTELPFTTGGVLADAAVASGRTCMIQTDADTLTAGWLANYTGTALCCSTRGYVVTGGSSICYAGCGDSQVLVDQFLKNPGGDECYVDCFAVQQNTCSPYPIGLGAPVTASVSAPVSTVHRDGFVVVRDAAGGTISADGAYAVNVGTAVLPTYLYCLNKGALSGGASVCSTPNNACLQSSTVFVSFSGSSTDGKTCFFNCYAQA